MDNIIQSSIPFDVLSADEAEYDKQAKALVARLQKEATNVTGANYLDVLDPSTQTILYIHVLNSYLTEASSNGKTAQRQVPQAALPEGSLWPYITRILLDFDATQVRYIGGGLCRIVNTVAQGAEQTSNLIPAIQLLYNVILRLDPTSSTLTTTHFSFVRLCLLARAYSDAVQILDLPIYSIPNDQDKSAQTRQYRYLCSSHDSSSAYLTTTTGLTMNFTSRKYLEYYLMAAMCYMGVRQYATAIFCLETLLTTPVVQSSTSTIQAEAYKKWLLLSLLTKGRTPPIPKGLMQPTLKVLRSVAKPYECLAESFKSGLGRLQREVHEGVEIWDHDNNTGLVLEVVHAFRKYAVLNLGKTFAALSMTEVARRTSPDSSDLSETTAYVSTLITSGQLHASLTPASQPGGSPTLRFLTSPEVSMSESQFQKELANKTVELQNLLRNISDNDHKFELSKDYVEYLKKLKKQKEQDAKEGPKVASFNESFEDDEELMTDM